MLERTACGGGSPVGIKIKQEMLTFGGHYADPHSHYSSGKPDIPFPSKSKFYNSIRIGL
jgi:hypothetical protein